MSPFSVTLRALRRTRAVTQKDAAEMLGYEQSYLSGLETGAKGPPKREFVDRLIKIYQLNEKERADLETALQQSKRTLMLPNNASIDEFWILNKLQNQIGRLQQRQIVLMKIALELGECCVGDPEQTRMNKEMEESRM